jgi:uncharacterized membrane protein
MKIVKVLLGCVLSIFLLLFIISFLTPSEYKTEITVTVDANVEKSFAIFCDEKNMEKWITGFVSIERLSGRNNEVGSTYKISMSDEGREIVMTETIMSFKENEYFAFDMENDDAFTSVDISFAALDSNTTKIVAKSLFIPRAMFIKVLMPLFESKMEEQQSTNYSNLKSLIETTSDLTETN